jgi:hypothetical protein
MGSRTLWAKKKARRTQPHSETECQLSINKFWALHLGLSKWQLVADIHKRGTGRLSQQKYNRNTLCPILEMSVNGASNIFGLASGVVQVTLCGNNSYTK